MKQFALLIIYSTPSLKSVAHITSQALWPNRLISPFIIHLPLCVCVCVFFSLKMTNIHLFKTAAKSTSITHPPNYSNCIAD